MNLIAFLSLILLNVANGEFFKYHYHISIDLTYYGIAMHKGLWFIVPTNIDKVKYY